jgi:hypothetical protein
LSTIPQHAWVSKLFGYQFSVEFKPGQQNTAADALSRHDEEPAMVHALSIPNFDLFDQFRHETATVSEIVAKRQEIESGAADPAWAIVDGMVVCHDRLFIRPGGRCLTTPMAWAMTTCRRRCIASAPPTCRVITS